MSGAGVAAGTPDVLRTIIRHKAREVTARAQRDPLAAVITCIHRDNNVARLLSSFVDLACKIDLPRELFKPNYVPWDLPEKLRFTWSNDTPEAATAEVQNTKGSYEAKRRYADGDKAWVVDYCGRWWQPLQRIEYVVRPMLEHIGYTNLMWWT